MRRSIILGFIVPFVVASVADPRPSAAQVDGVRVEGGPVFVTKSGRLDFGTSAIESDVGFAVSGKVRVGMGGLSVAGEVQGSSQDYTNTNPSTPDNLSATFVGVTGAVHPVSVAGITPYADIGIGKLFLADDRITGDDGVKASTYGLGVLVGGGKFSADASLRLMRQSGLRVQGVANEFKYDPKLFSVLLTIRL